MTLRTGLVRPTFPMLALTLFAHVAAAEITNGPTDTSAPQATSQNNASQSSPGNPEVDAKTTSMESEIVSKIHMTNQMEQKVGGLAKEKGTTAEVRRYGDRLIRDHKMADRMILALAKRQGLVVTKPEPKTPEEQSMMQKEMEGVKKLEQASGSQFDQAFLMMMKQGHDQAIGMLSDAHDKLPTKSELRDLIGKMIPILQQHDKLAENLQSSPGKAG